MNTPERKRIVVLCQDFSLAALPLLALKKGGHAIIAVWGSDSQPAAPTFSRVQHESLLNATSINLSNPAGSVLLGSVPVKNIATLCHELEIPYKGVTPLYANAVGMAIKNLEIDLVLSIGLETTPPHNMVGEDSKPWFNLHLGSLPDDAGIDPTFWEFAQGREFGAITLHRVGPNVWDGTQLATEQISLTENQRTKRYEEVIEEKLTASALLLAQSLTHASLSETPLSLGTPHDRPDTDHLTIEAEMSCDQIARFVSGLSRRHPITFNDGEQTYLIEGSTTRDLNRKDGNPGDTEHLGHERLGLRCQDGWITLVAARAPVPKS